MVYVTLYKPEQESLDNPSGGVTHTRSYRCAVPVYFFDFKTLNPFYMADVLNNSINNAVSEADKTSALNSPVCISVVHGGWVETAELHLSYDSGEEQIIKLSVEQRVHLIKLLSL